MFHWPALVLVAAFVPYWRTLHPTVHTFDVAEFAAGAWDLGLVHNPGYPTYLLLAHLFQLLPLGDPAYRLNLLSALAASLTVALLAQLVWTLVRARLPALVAALLFAYSAPQWSEAIIATPYTLNTAALALELLLLLRWREDRRTWRLGAAAALYGLQFGLHASAALQAPGLALLALTAGPGLDQLSARLSQTRGGGRLCPFVRATGPRAGRDARPTSPGPLVHATGPRAGRDARPTSPGPLVRATGPRAGRDARPTSPGPPVRATRPRAARDARPTSPRPPVRATEPRAGRD
ncbi:MAG: DUF2723 domain-containing protein, partial [Chloroflexi bacterium]|nr:DUF2723 domain-containing protein [Chloroflexota bacterium]